MNHRILIGIIFISTAALTSPGAAKEGNLIPSGHFQFSDAVKRLPEDFELQGDATFGVLGDPARENNGRGVRLLSGNDANKDGRHEGNVSTTIHNLRPSQGRWYRLRIHALAQDGFQVGEDDLYLEVEFFRDGGKNSLDHVKKSLYELVERDRKALADAGTNRNLGRATWRYFDLEFRTPFPEVDTLTVKAGFGHGKGTGLRSEFWINEIELSPIAVPADYTPPQGGKITLGKDALKLLAPLGGRWYFDPRGGDRNAPPEFNSANADRLYYLTDRLEAPFAGNMSAWLRKGYLDPAGNEVKTDRLVEDNVTVSLTKTHLVIKSKNLPNHPTAVFPDRTRSLDGNPNFLQEKYSTWYIPLEPKENPRHAAMKDRSNNNSALPRGPIGVAVNGIVFFNPFDHLLNEDAVWRVDRCCGHPSPNYMYHYHKYPVCVKSPWADDGEGHSPLIGFAFDGFPVYGPYEAKGRLAKDDVENPLNEFNIHRDNERG